MFILRRVLGSDGTEKCCGHHDQTISWISVLNGFMWKNINFVIPIVIFFFFDSCFPMVPIKAVSF